MKELQFSLMIIGAVAIIGFVILIGILLWGFVTDWVRNLKWQYKYKHRFYKQPTAQCYCKDCRYYISYNSNSGRCGRGHIEKWNIADKSFCWQAEPLKSDPEVKK